MIENHGDGISKPFKVNLTGKTFGRLTVLGPSELRQRADGRNKRFWLCLCDCGVEKYIPGNSLNTGRTSSCGCLQAEVISKLRKTHGCAGSAYYRTWSCMIQRCTNRANPKWKLYGGRGITVCERWASFENFLADMGPRPSTKHTIDRKDNDGNYEPSNCRWATQSEQQNNKRNNFRVTWQGRTQTVTEWGRELGFSNLALSQRLRAGWTVERALTTPLQHRHDPRKL